MFDCNKDIKEFHDDKVSLGEPQKKSMRKRRDTNRKRLKNGLIKNDDPTPDDNVAQGSYSMYTMTQDDENDYDIDDGAVFLREELENGNGKDMSSLKARKMVCNALDDKSFNTPPEVLKNCVRVYYNDGPHVDVPVYRKNDDGTLELASAEWKGSSPTEVTEWYKDSVIRQSPDILNGRQMRRITKHMKFHSKSRKSWKNKMPSGFAISKLIDEGYMADNERDDVALYNTMTSIKNRLDWNLVIDHPTRYETITKTNDDADIKFLREKLGKAIEDLDVLFDADCTRLKALEAWHKVFNHDFFEKKIKDEKDKSKHALADILSAGNKGVVIGASGVAVSSAGAAIKTTAAFGGSKKNYK